MRDIENEPYDTIQDGIEDAHSAEWYVFVLGDGSRYIAVHNGWHPRELRHARPAGDYFRWVKMDPVSEERTT